MADTNEVMAKRNGNFHIFARCALLFTTRRLAFEGSVDCNIMCNLRYTRSGRDIVLCDRHNYSLRIALRGDE
jgi:hypothetical protein